MSELNVCPACGTTIQDNSARQCPACGTALSAPASSAATLISRPISKKAEFESSAEAVDEIKRMVNEGNTDGATQIASAAFDLPPEAAQTAVEQIKTDMPFSGTDKTMLAGSAAFASNVAPQPTPAPERPAPARTPVEVIDAGSPHAYNTPVDPPKQSNKQKWIVGGSIGAAVFLCLCCCLPLALILFNLRRNGG
jgi:guanyl-specific ribonuclease Sa